MEKCNNIFTVFVPDKEEAINIASLIQSKPKFCQNCQVVVKTPSIRKKSMDFGMFSPSHYDLPEEEDMTFCSTECADSYETTQRALSESMVAQREYLVGRSSWCHDIY